ncbi:XdhC family protein [Rhodococcus sp. NPDC059968]|uniref:XdhC family protein n=1 Tax=Rhodococcus sp. NPDC059968 TaxID=3347017 RepID=UPI00366ECA75
MRELLDEVLRLTARGETVGLATVVATFHSAPREPGAAMLVAADGTVSGSVSGGCVEGAVYELASEVVNDEVPVLQRYGVTDEDAFSVGLTCGGILDVFVEKIVDAPWLRLLGDSVAAERPVALATVIEHPDRTVRGAHLLVWPDDRMGSLGSESADEAVTDDVRGVLATGRSVSLHYGPAGQRRGEGMTVFVSSYEPQPRMLVFGAIDFAAALVRLGSFLGYRVTVCDARPVFATASRFPEADEVVVDWPHRYLEKELQAGRVDRRTVVSVLTHDPKFDIPLLSVALRADIGYVGAMGSRKTHADRINRLREQGFSSAELELLSSPVGLDLGARTPEETAVSIAAEIISLRWGGQGVRLSALKGPIHRDSAVVR